MERRITKLVAITFLSFLAVIPCFAEDLSGWKYSKDIVSSGSSKYKSVFVDGEIYRNAKADLSDLRIVNDKNEFVPYYIENAYSVESRSQIGYGTEQIDLRAGKKDTVIDYKVVGAEDVRDALINKLVIHTDRKDYLQKLEIYGSIDGVKWDYAADGMIYRLNDYVKEDIVFDRELKYKYYRLKLLNDVEKIRPVTVEGQYILSQGGSRPYIKDTKLAYEITTKDKQTTVIIRNDDRLKIAGIHLKAEGMFKREYTVYEMEKDSEAFTADGTLYSTEFKGVKLANTDIDLSAAPLMRGQIKLVIEDRDNKALDIQDIQISYRVDKLVFPAENAGSFRIYYGNNEASGPSYDIETYRVNIENEVQDLCELGITQEHSAEAPEEPKKDYGLYLNITIITVALILVIVIARKINRR